MESKTVGIIGGGAWGTGLAQALARGKHSVQIWALEDEVVDSILSIESIKDINEWKDKMKEQYGVTEYKEEQ